MKNETEIIKILNKKDFEPTKILGDIELTKVIQLLEELVEKKETLKTILEDEQMSENLYEFISFLILFNQSKKKKKDEYTISTNTFSPEFSNLILLQ